MRRIVLCALMACAFVWPSLLHAQSDRPRLVRGDRVRIVGATAQGEFVLTARSGDTLSLRNPSSPSDSIVVSMATLDRLDLRVPRSRGAGALRGGGIGLLAGAGLGAIVGLASGNDGNDCWVICSGTEKAYFFGLFFGAIGGAAGTIVGFAVPGEHWERVEMVRRVGVRRGVDGAMMVTYSLAF